MESWWQRIWIRSVCHNVYVCSIKYLTIRYIKEFEMSFILSSLGYFIESKYDWKWVRVARKTSSVYRNVELKVIAKPFFHIEAFEINSFSEEYKNRSVNRLAQVVPKVMITVYWWTRLSKNTNRLSTRNFQYLSNFIFNVLVHRFRVMFNNVSIRITYHKIWIFPNSVFIEEATACVVQFCFSFSKVFLILNLM